MAEKKAIFTIDILKKIADIYFNTFFVFYFFKVANYEILPLAKYYLTQYIFIGIGFYLIRQSMKRNIKVPFYRIGVSLQALYISAIMLLKDNIINYIFLVSILKGIADGFYWFPKNVMNSEKIDNKDRQKFSGKLSIINEISAIIVPLIMGVALTYITYVNLGKIFFVIFIIIFILTFFLKDEKYNLNKYDGKGFRKLLKENKDIRSIFYIPLLSGFTYSSGVMGLIITLIKINNFKTNLNLGIVDSICALLSLLASIYYTYKLKNKGAKPILLVSGIISFLVLVLEGIANTKITLIIYLLMRFSLVLIINLISSQVQVNLANTSEVKKKYRSEYFLFMDLCYAITRSIGYILLLIICITVGMNYIQYLLFLPAIAILVQSIVVYKLVDKS